MKIGELAPSFKLRALPTKRKVTIPDSQRVPMLLLFLSANTSMQIEDVVKNVRLHEPDVANLLVVIVFDLCHVPRMQKKTAESMIRASYDQAAQHLPDGFDPVDYLILVPDWQGKLFKAFGIKDANKNAGVALIDRSGHVAGFYQGKAVVPAALEILRS